MSNKKKIPPLEFEIVQEPTNLHFLTMLEYKKENFLTIIDNITDEEITAFVLDKAQQSGIPVKDFLSVVTHWYYSGSESHPLSIELARHGMTQKYDPIITTFDINYITRIVGKPFIYSLAVSKVKRRRIIPVPEGVEIRLKRQA